MLNILIISKTNTIVNRINNMINGIIQVYHLIKIILTLLIMTDLWKMKIGMQKVLKVNLIIFHNVRNAPNSFLKIRHVIRDSGKETFVMVMVHKSGQMELSMKVIGKIIKLTVKEFSGMFMEINMRENGKKTIKSKAAKFFESWLWYLNINYIINYLNHW